MNIFYHTLFTVFIIYFFSFNVQNFIFYSAQKKKLSKRRSGGFKVKPTNQDGATAETKGVDNDATEKESENEFENEEYGDAEILAACTIQSCWKLYRLKQMFGMYFKSEESEHRVYGSTVVDISIKPPSFKLVSLSSPRSPLFKTPKHVIF